MKCKFGGKGNTLFLSNKIFFYIEQLVKKMRKILNFQNS
jgi:hypothetical protein